MMNKRLILIIIIVPLLFNFYGCGGGGGGSSTTAVIPSVSSTPADFHLSGQILIPSQNDSLFHANPETVNSVIQKAPPAGMEYLHQGVLTLGGKKTILDSTGQFSFKGKFIEPGTHILSLQTRVKTIEYILVVKDFSRMFLTLYIHDNLDKIDFVESEILFSDNKETEITARAGLKNINTSTEIERKEVAKKAPRSSNESELLAILNAAVKECTGKIEIEPLVLNPDEIIIEEEKTDINLGEDYDKIELNPGILNLLQFEKYNLEALIHSTNGNVTDISSKIVLRSTNENIVKISGREITGETVGKTKITAVYNGLESNPIDVNVAGTQPDSIKLEISKTEIETLETSAIAVIADYGNGVTRNVTSLAEIISPTGKKFNINNGLFLPDDSGLIDLKAKFMNLETGVSVIKVNNPILNISLNIINTVLPLGSETEFKIVASLKDGKTEEITANYTLEFSDVSILENNGNFKGIKTGSTDVTAEYENFVSPVVKIIVGEKEIKKLEVLYDSDKLYMGETINFTAKLIYTDESFIDVTNLVQLTNNNNNIEINGTVITPLNTGTVKISSLYDGTVGEVFNLEVLPERLVTLNLDSSIVNIPTGYQSVITLKGTYSNGDVRDVIDSAVFSYDENKISISSGKISALNEGNTLLKAVIGEISSNELNITVTEKIPDSLVLTATSAVSVPEGVKIGIETKIIYSDSSNEIITSGCLYEYSNAGVVEFDGDTSLNTTGEGTSNIKAKIFGLESNTIDIVITEKELESILVAAQKTEIALGDKIPISVSGIYTNKTQVDLLNTGTHTISPGNGLALVNGELQSSLTGNYTVRSEYNGITSNELAVVVGPEEPRSIDLILSSQTTAKGRNIIYKTELVYSDASREEVVSVLNYTDDGIFNTGAGFLIANSVGTTIVKAVYDSFESEGKQIECTPAEIDSITLSSGDISDVEGRTFNIVVTAHKSDNSTELITDSALYVIGDENIISVVNGFLTLENPGTSTLIVRKDGIDSETINIEVLNPVVDNVNLTLSKTVARHGETVPAEIKAIWSNGDETDITGTAQINLSVQDAAEIIGTGLKIHKNESFIVSATYNSVNSSNVSVTVTPLFREIITGNKSSTAVDFLVITESDPQSLSVEYGLSGNLTETKTVVSNNSITMINISGLNDNTAYESIVKGDTGLNVAVDDNNGNNYDFSTAKIGIGSTYILTGQFLKDGTPYVGGAVVISKTGSEPLIAISGSDGYFFVNLANLKTSTGEVMSSAAGDSFDLRYIDGEGNETVSTYVLTGSSPDKI